MDTKDFNERWPEIKAKIKQEHPEISDHELEYMIGEEVKLLEKLQAKTGKTRSEIYKWLHIMG
ncbi:MAG: general stress protein CsbD [Chitinophagales bacterium]|nr:general stress protein CsbD [Chitinophagales bacterium]